MVMEMNHLFLQACANHGCLQQQTALAILTPIWHKYKHERSTPSENDLQHLIDEINGDIARFDQRIEALKYELDGNKYVVFANSSGAEINKIQHHLTENERVFFRTLIKEIVVNPEFAIRWIVATNLSCGTPAVAKTRLQGLLEDWISMGYFHQKESLVYLGPKTLAEFGHYLKENFPDHINQCSLCKAAVFWGVSCQEEDCTEMFHNPCIRKYLIKRSVCPSCKKTWNTPLTSSQN